MYVNLYPTVGSRISVDTVHVMFTAVSEGKGFQIGVHILLPHGRGVLDGGRGWRWELCMIEWQLLFQKRCPCRERL